jgi:C1A family cysteine protease
MPGKHHFGWVRDLPDHRDLSYSAPLGRLQNMPASVDLRKQCPPVYDQGQIGSCTANAIAAAVEFGRKKGGETPDFVPSRLFIYYNERAMEHTIGSDAGAQIRDGIKSIANQGVCPEPEWPYQPTPADPNTGLFPPKSAPATKPPAKCYKDGLAYKAIAYLAVQQSLSQMKGCLAEGYPFVFGFTVYSSIYDASGNPVKVLPMPGGKDTVEGGHAVLAVGYNDSKRLITVRNSWGPTVQDHGYFYMPYGYISDSQLASDFWTVRKIED